MNIMNKDNYKFSIKKVYCAFLYIFFISFSFSTPFSNNSISSLKYIFNCPAQADEFKFDENGIKDPVLSTLMEKDVVIPHTDQIKDGKMSNLINMKTEDALGAKNMLGYTIQKISNPHDDLREALENLSNNAKNGIISSNDAREIMNILLGTTQGRIYDGFSLLNFNRWNNDAIPKSAFPGDVVSGEYKTKTIRHSGKKERTFKKPSDDVNPDLINDEDKQDKDINEVTIWEVDVNMLWYGSQFDSDTFFIHVPVINSSKKVPSMDDTLRINYHIYSLVNEDFAPTQLLLDANPGIEFPGGGSVQLPYKGGESVWIEINKNTVNHITVQHTALRFLKGIYTWGWRVHPPRVQFLNFLFELTNAHTEKNELDPRSQSYSIRNRELDIDGIGESAPEKKIYKVVKKVLDGKISAEELFEMLNNPDKEPRGTYVDWMNLMTNQIQLPPEVNDILKTEGKTINNYDYAVAFLNNEMYGSGTFGETIRDWDQGDVVKVRVFNMDNHTHYYKNVDFGPALSTDFTDNVINGIFSFETMNYKPNYGEPKAAEMLWRSGWGFRPNYSVIQQEGVFPRDSDKKQLKPFTAPVFSKEQMNIYYGYQFSKSNRRGDFIFNPPRYIIEREKDKNERIQQKDNRRAYDYLYEFSNDYSHDALQTILNHWEQVKKRTPEILNKGIVIGQETEGFGIAKMCDHFNHDGHFCKNDLSQFHPLNIKNVDTDRNVNDGLYFPTFLINPNKNGGDIIPPTMDWGPFLFISPKNGTIFIDPENPEKGYWVDLTYAHGMPVSANSNIEVNIEMPRAKGQLFYQFDDLFHDNDIFSPHPISSQR